MSTKKEGNNSNRASNEKTSSLPRTSDNRLSHGTHASGSPMVTEPKKKPSLKATINSLTLKSKKGTLRNKSFYFKPEMGLGRGDSEFERNLKKFAQDAEQNFESGMEAEAVVESESDQEEDDIVEETVIPVPRPLGMPRGSRKKQSMKPSNGRMLNRSRNSLAPAAASVVPVSVGPPPMPARKSMRPSATAANLQLHLPGSANAAQQRVSNAGLSGLKKNNSLQHTRSISIMTLTRTLTRNQSIANGMLSPTLKQNMQEMELLANSHDPNAPPDDFVDEEKLESLQLQLTKEAKANEEKQEREKDDYTRMNSDTGFTKYRNQCKVFAEEEYANFYKEAEKQVEALEKLLGVDDAAMKRIEASIRQTVMKNDHPITKPTP